MPTRTRFLTERFADRPARTKIAILGFTSHRTQAPWEDPDWELWLLNDLYFEHLAALFRKDRGLTVERLRWFQLHHWVELKDWGKAEGPEFLHPAQGPPHPRDPNHLTWLKEASQYFPIYLRDAHEALPDCLPYPREAVYDYFRDGLGKPIKYFTNSISWEIAMAIMELTAPIELPDGRTLRVAVPGAAIGVWGVDMMQAGGAGSEYGWQRPSCEWLLAWAQSCGIETIVPDESDLLKAAYQYGDEDGYYFRKRIAAYKADVDKQGAAAQQNMNGARDHLLRMEGAKGALEWVERSHMPGDDGSPAGRAPIPNSHKPTALQGTVEESGPTPFGSALLEEFTAPDKPEKNGRKRRRAPKDRLAAAKAEP